MREQLAHLGRSNRVVAPKRTRTLPRAPPDEQAHLDRRHDAIEIRPGQSGDTGKKVIRVSRIIPA